MSAKHAAPRGRKASNNSRPLSPETVNEQFSAPTGRHRKQQPNGFNFGELRERSKKMLSPTVTRRLGAGVLALAVLSGVHIVGNDGGIDAPKPYGPYVTAEKSSDSIAKAGAMRSYKRLGKFGIKASATPTPETTPEPKPFPYYSQYDSVRADRPYGYYGKTIESSGCIPSGLAMIDKMLTGKEVKPGTITDKHPEAYIHLEGTSWNLIHQNGREYGLDVEQVDDYENAEQKVIDTLKDGGYALTTGGGDNARLPFTGSGHAVVIRSVVEADDTPSGYRFQLANPMPEKGLRDMSSEEITKTDWYNQTFSYQRGLVDAGMHSLFLITNPEAEQ